MPECIRVVYRVGQLASPVTDPCATVNVVGGWWCQIVIITCLAAWQLGSLALDLVLRVVVCVFALLHGQPLC